jgi:fused signal recognition particle receptor
MIRNLFSRNAARPEITEEDKQHLEDAVKKTKEGALGRISQLFRQPIITEDTWDQLEELLIQADVGPVTAMTLVSEARKRVAREELKTPVEAETAVRLQMVELLGEDDHIPLEAMSAGTIVLIVGVNGSGKTTSVAKLGALLQRKNKTILLAAGDTFRAAAIDQLRVWGERIKAPVIAHQQDADPGAVIFDAIKASQSRQVDFVLADTAGRLHTKFNLMEELQKIKRVATKASPDAPILSLLVLDATTGQNALLQAQHFLQAVDVDGIILAKLDGTAKGGVAFSVYNELKVPIWYVGTGEKINDFAPFDHLEFVNALFE